MLLISCESVENLGGKEKKMLVSSIFSFSTQGFQMVDFQGRKPGIVC